MTAVERGDWLDHAASCETCRAIANTLPAEPAAVAPPTIGRFVPTREIGRGAMGVVYAADDPELGRPIALKLLHDATDGERLHREARALAKLSHDNVVRVYDVGVDTGRVWVAMELVDGVTLRAWLKQAHGLDEVLELLLRAGRGLAAAHDAGIVHRDFKPDNVLIGGGRVVVGDFGLSKLGAIAEAAIDERVLDSSSDDKLTRTGAAVGTPAYMAPEQISGEATAATDQFAFCVTAWEALFGVRPFRGATLRELREASLEGYFTKPANRAVPRRTERVLRRGLAGAPAERFPSMAALLAELAPPRRKRWYVAPAAAVLACAGGVAYAVTDRSTDPCEAAGASIFDVWTPDARDRLAVTSGAAAVSEVDDYARAWQATRVATCERADDPARRAAREICLERARVELSNQLRVQASAEQLRTFLVPLASCEAEVALPKTPGYEVDPRGCGCPYSACDDETKVCSSQCTARAFRAAGPVAGVARPGAQEAIAGASNDGTTLLYLSGVAGDSDPCALNHLYLARRRGETYDSIDLTTQLARHGLKPFEGCCTITSDGRSVLVAHRRRHGLVQLDLDGDTLSPGPDDFGGLLPEAAPTLRTWFPVISADRRTLYFLVQDDGGKGGSSGAYQAQRASTDVPFERATRMTGRAALYEYVTGISADGRSLFMATEYATSVLVRGADTEVFGDLGIGKPPMRLPGWRAIPFDNCRRLITTQSPGGCGQEDTVILEAVGP